MKAVGINQVSLDRGACARSLGLEARGKCQVRLCLRGWQSNLRATHLSLPAPFLLFGVTTLERSAMWFMRTRRSAHKGQYHGP